MPAGLILYLYISVVCLGIAIQIIAALGSALSTRRFTWFKNPRLALIRIRHKRREGEERRRYVGLPTSTCRDEGDDDNYEPSTDNNNSINSTRCSVSVAKRRAQQQRAQGRLRAQQHEQTGSDRDGNTTDTTNVVSPSPIEDLYNLSNDPQTQTSSHEGFRNTNRASDSSNIVCGSPSDLERPSLALFISAALVVALLTINAAFVYAHTYTGGRTNNHNDNSLWSFLAGGNDGEADLACRPFYGRVALYNTSGDGQEGDGHNYTNYTTAPTSTTTATPITVSVGRTADSNFDNFFDNLQIKVSKEEVEVQRLKGSRMMPLGALITPIPPLGHGGEGAGAMDLRDVGGLASSGSRTFMSASAAMSAFAALSLVPKSAYRENDTVYSYYSYAHHQMQQQQLQHNVVSSNNNSSLVGRSIIGFHYKEEFEHFYDEASFCSRSLLWIIHIASLIIAAVVPCALYGCVYAPFLAAGGFNDSEGERLPSAMQGEEGSDAGEPPLAALRHKERGVRRGRGGKSYTKISTTITATTTALDVENDDQAQAHISQPTHGGGWGQQERRRVPDPYAAQRAFLFWSPLRSSLRTWYYLGLFGSLLPIVSEGTRLLMMLRFGEAQLCFGATLLHHPYSTSSSSSSSHFDTTGEGPCLVGIVGFALHAAALLSLVVGWCAIIGPRWLFISKVFVIFSKIPEKRQAVNGATASNGQSSDNASGTSAASNTNKTRTASQKEGLSPLDSLSLDFELIPSVARREMRESGSFVPHSVLSTLWRRWRGPFLYLAFLRLFQEVLGLVPALLLRELVDGMATRQDEGGEGEISSVLEMNIRRGATAVIGLIACSLASTLIRTHYDLKHSKIGLYSKAVLSTACYEHAAALKPFQRLRKDRQGTVIITATAKHNEDEKEKKVGNADEKADGTTVESSEGNNGSKSNTTNTEIKDADIINHLLVDVPRVCDQISNLNNIWCLPCQIGFALFLLYLQIGWGFLAGLFLTIAMVPTNAALCKKIGKINVDMMRANDARVGAITEVISNIKFVKMCGWSESVFERVAVPRAEFMACLTWVKYLDGVCAFFWASTPVLVSLASFITYAGLFDGVLTPGKVIASLALFNTLILPLNSYPWVLSGAVEAWVSLGRLDSFLYDYVPSGSSAEDEGGADDDIDEDAPVVVEGEGIDEVAQRSAMEKNSEQVLPQIAFGKEVSSIVLEGIVVRRGALLPSDIGAVRRDCPFAELMGGRKRRVTAASSSSPSSANVSTSDAPSCGDLAPQTAAIPIPPMPSPQTNKGGMQPFEVFVKRLVLRPGALTVITGPAGSGKSTLLAGLAQEAAVLKYTRSILKRSRGRASDGSPSSGGGAAGSFSALPSMLPSHLTVAYLPQEAFVMDCSVRDNILFDKQQSDDVSDAFSAPAEGTKAMDTTKTNGEVKDSKIISRPSALRASGALRVLDSFISSAKAILGGREVDSDTISLAASHMKKKMTSSLSSSSLFCGQAEDAALTSAPLPNTAPRTKFILNPTYKYKLILEATCLMVDMAQWPAGDLRRAGDRGDGLSGGQKHRVALARALYSDADVYLIDDSLGALDGQVSSHIVRTCVAEMLLKNCNKYVVMVSEHPEVLKLAEESGGEVYTMEGGVLKGPIVASSPTNRLVPIDGYASAASGSSLGSSSSAAAAVMSTTTTTLWPLLVTEGGPSASKTRENVSSPSRGSLRIDTERKKKERGDEDASSVSKGVLPDAFAFALDSAIAEALSSPEIAAEEDKLVSNLTPTQTLWLDALGLSHNNTLSTAVMMGGLKKGEADNETPVDGEEQARIAREEEEAENEIKETGSISMAIFWSYIVAMGVPLFLFVVVFIVAMQGVRNYSDVYVATWTADHDDKNERSDSSSSSYRNDVNEFLKFMGILAAANVCLALIRGLSFAFAGLKACVTIHDDVVTRVLGSPFSFFSSVPRGRLINRLSRDIYCVDESLPFMFNIFLAQLVMFLGAIIVIGVTSSFAVLGGAVPVVFILYCIQRPYRRANREMKRLESAARSPIVDHLRTLLEGGTIMRCLGGDCVPFFVNKALRDYTIWHRLTYNLSMLQWWFGLNMQLIGVGIVALVGIVTIVVNTNKNEGSNEGGDAGSGPAASMGLALAYVAPLTSYISNLLGSFTELEKLFISVERVEEYRALETEGRRFKARRKAVAAVENTEVENTTKKRSKDKNKKYSTAGEEKESASPLLLGNRDDNDDFDKDGHEPRRGDNGLICGDEGHLYSSSSSSQPTCISPPCPYSPEDSSLSTRHSLTSPVMMSPTDETAKASPHAKNEKRGSVTTSGGSDQKGFSLLRFVTKKSSSSSPARGNRGGGRGGPMDADDDDPIYLDDEGNGYIHHNDNDGDDTNDRGADARASMSSAHSLSTVVGEDGRRTSSMTAGKGGFLSSLSSPGSSLACPTNYLNLTPQTLVAAARLSFPMRPLVSLPPAIASSSKRYNEWLSLLDHQWPFQDNASGGVVFNNVSVRYIANGPLVLKGITCHIKHGQKVALVGRTGSGKSSLIMSLLGLVDLHLNAEGSGKESTEDQDEGSLMGGLSLSSPSGSYTSPPYTELNHSTNEKLHSTEASPLESEEGKGSASDVSSKALNTTKGSRPFIAISGIDTRLLEPEWMRRHLTVLPQECLVLEGSIYSNLDSSGRVSSYSNNHNHTNNNDSDANLLPLSERYRRAIMRSVLAALGLARFDLFHGVESGGKNLSAGERSLISIARVIVDCFAMPSSSLGSNTHDTATDVGCGVSDEVMRNLLAPAVGLISNADDEQKRTKSPLTQGQQSISYLPLERAPKKAKARIVIMDEPAASLDGESEERLWSLVVRCFAESTVLAITHKLKAVVGEGKHYNTDNNNNDACGAIVDQSADSVPTPAPPKSFFNRALVMSGGLIIADDSPAELLRRGVGPFASMLRDEEEENEKKKMTSEREQDC